MILEMIFKIVGTLVAVVGMLMVAMQSVCSCGHRYYPWYYDLVWYIVVAIILIVIWI